MDAVTPTPIKLEDLTRDELLQLVSQVAPFLTSRQLWRARWEVAMTRHAATSDKAMAAGKRRVAASDAHANAPLRSQQRTWKAYRAAADEHNALCRAADRAWATSQRIYRAYDAADA